MSAKFPGGGGSRTFFSSKSTLIQIHLPKNRCCYVIEVQLRNEFNVWNVHGIVNTSDLLQS